ncbi:hypothetical protein F2Q69_00023286 [Brassica cretica]|uniref:Uncharacterized protein n=1 Tax=Brassica cretica TaxID=69181 RepID=A0A8S9Q0B4_BRACR|nr:hypothetical protein F2Q69_00023286 [Brassica cretica]
MIGRFRRSLSTRGRYKLTAACLQLYLLAQATVSSSSAGPSMLTEAHRHIMLTAAYRHVYHLFWPSAL